MDHDAAPGHGGTTSTWTPPEAWGELKPSLTEHLIAELKAIRADLKSCARDTEGLMYEDGPDGHHLRGFVASADTNGPPEDADARIWAARARVGKLLDLLEKCSEVGEVESTIDVLKGSTPRPTGNTAPAVGVPFKLTRATLGVLGALADGAARYGYEIAEITGFAPGTVNVILNRLRERGWAHDSWDTVKDRTPEIPAADRPGARRRYFWIDKDHLADVQKLLAPQEPS